MLKYLCIKVKEQVLKIKDLYDRYGYFLYVLVVPLYLVLFFVTEGMITSESEYFVSYLPIDDVIPFCEWFAVPYVSWYLYMFAIGVFLLCREPDGARRYLVNIGLSFHVFILVSLLFPNGQDLRVNLDTLGRDNFCIDIMRWVYSADTNTNVCPSMHTVGTLCVIAATLHSKEIKSTAFKVLYTLWGVFIIGATVFLKQHSVLDILVAFPYALVFYVISYRVLKFNKHYEPVVKPKKRNGKSNRARPVNVNDL